MATLKDPSLVLAMLEGGSFPNKLRAKLKEAVKTLHDIAGEKGTAKGSITLKINLKVRGGTCEITPDLSAKLPTETPMPETLFITSTGELSDEHPRQMDMKFPRTARPADDTRDTGTDD